MSLFGKKDDVRVERLVKDVEELRKRLNSFEAQHKAEMAELTKTFTVVMDGYSKLAKLVIHYKGVVEQLCVLVNDRIDAAEEQEQEFAELPELPLKNKKDMN